MDNIVNANADFPEAAQMERTETQIVKSQYIAGELCSYAPYFKDLIAIRKDKFKENRRVWVLGGRRSSTKILPYWLKNLKNDVRTRRM